MDKLEAIEILKDMKSDKEKIIKFVPERHNSFFLKRIKTLEMAIEALEKTAHEVSINKQENLISLNISIDKEKLTREIIKLINDSQANKSIGLIDI